MFTGHKIILCTIDVAWNWVYLIVAWCCIWRHRSESALAQVMACLTAPNHNLKQCWLTISKVWWYWSQGINIRKSEDTNQSNKTEICILFNCCIRISQGPMILNKCSIERVKAVLHCYPDSRDPQLNINKMSIGTTLDWCLLNINLTALLSRYVFVSIGRWALDKYIHVLLNCQNAIINIS